MRWNGHTKAMSWRSGGRFRYIRARREGSPSRRASTGGPLPVRSAGDIGISLTARYSCGTASGMTFASLMISLLALDRRTIPFFSRVV